ncbi:MAG: FUSC family protein [Sedimentitalea sp.]|uniref:FUSC family protein n=1 Tax=Sedimentitalea sp. TaxID=2048915 RepID=UPI00326342AD
MTTVSAPFSQLVAQAWQDLQPFEGRFALAWRVALLCALVTGVAMTFRIPEAAISCYLVIFLMKPDAVMNCLLGIGLILLASLVVLLMIPVINFSIDSAAMRLAIMFFASYFFLFLSATTPLGEQAAIVGLIIAFIMSLVTSVPIGQIGDQGLLAAWKMACMPMALMVLFNLILGVPAQTHVRNLIVKRLETAALELELSGNPEDLTEMLAEGNDPSLQQMVLVRILNLVPRPQSTWLNGAIETSYRLLLASQAPLADIQIDRRPEIAAQIRQMAKQIAGGSIPAAPEFEPQSHAEQTCLATLQGLARSDGGAAPKPTPQALLAADAFTNPDYQRYALKTSIAAMLCYLIYTGIQWDGIHTALITCYVAALGTTGETVRKLTLRIVGCLFGAALGCAALLFVMPSLTSVGGLMLLVFGAVLIAAWVSSGNERISYCGVQIALAFLLTTLNGFGPSFEFSQAGDRIGGILLGIFVIYVIFTQFWPASIYNRIHRELAETATRVYELARLSQPERSKEIASSAAILKTLSETPNALSMASFEPRHQRADATTLARCAEIRDELEMLFRTVWFAETVPPTALFQLSTLNKELSNPT